MHDLILKQSQEWYIFPYQRAKSIFLAILLKDIKLNNSDTYGQFFTKFSPEKIALYLH